MIPDPIKLTAAARLRADRPRGARQGDAQEVDQAWART